MTYDRELFKLAAAARPGMHNAALRWLGERLAKNTAALHIGGFVADIKRGAGPFPKSGTVGLRTAKKWYESLGRKKPRKA